MRDWKTSFRALWIAEFIAITGFQTSNPILPLYLGELGLSDPQAVYWWTGAINSSAAIALAVFAPIWGAVADGYGRRLMLLRAMVGGTILVGLMAFAREPWQILALKTLQGCVTGTVAAATVLTASIVPAKEAGYRLGLLQMAVFLGNSAGPLFGGVVADLAGARFTFLATSALLAFSVYIVLTRVEENFTPKPKSKSLLRNALPDFSVLAKSPALASLLFVTFSVQLANMVVGPIIPLIVKELAGGGAGIASLSGLIIAASSMAGALAAVVVGKISARLGYGRALLLCLGGAFVFYLPQGLVRSPYALLALRVGSGFFLGGTMPSVNALIASLCDRDKQGSTYGLSASVSSAGGAIGPALGAVVATSAGNAAVFYATSAILALTGLAVGAGVRARAKGPHGGSADGAPTGGAPA